MTPEECRNIRKVEKMLNGLYGLYKSPMMFMKTEIIGFYRDNIFYVEGIGVDDRKRKFQINFKNKIIKEGIYNPFKWTTEYNEIEWKNVAKLYDRLLPLFEDKMYEQLLKEELAEQNRERLEKAKERAQEKLNDF